jgi:hypothetical protein
MTTTDLGLNGYSFYILHEEDYKYKPFAVAEESGTPIEKLAITT